MTSPPGGGTVARPKRARVDADLVRPCPLHVRANVREQLEHRLDIADAGDVRETHLVRGEDACSEDRECAVLVPRRPDTAAQRAASLNHEGLHCAGNGTDRLHEISASMQEGARSRA